MRGRVVAREGLKVIVEAGGVGYEVEVLPELAEAGEVELFVYHHQTERGQALYGFKTPSQRALFGELLKVQGLGPSGAMRILAAFGEEELRRVIEAGDPLPLTAVKGVGRKTAEKIIFYLKGKLPAAEAPVSEDAVGALVSLGMKKEEARRAVLAALKRLGSDAPVEELVREALKESVR